MEAEEYALKKFVKMNRNFKFFLNNIAYDGYDENYKTPSHTLEWAELIEEHNRLAILSARYHLKSTTIYHFIIWLLLNNPYRDMEILYISYKKEMAEYHTKKIKQIITKHPLCRDFKELTDAESILKYSADGLHKFIVEPEGVMGFKRGRHPDIVICDDILQDPSQELNLTVIDKITKVFEDDISNLPKPNGKLILIGTAQHQNDLFFKIKEKVKQNKTDFIFREYKAIIDDANKKVLWPEVYPYDLLAMKRSNSEKSFNKEFMCSPVWSEDSFFTRDQIMSLVNINLKNRATEKTKDHIIVAGWDIGKHLHPSHFAVFLTDKDKYTQIWQEFFDNTDYTKQLEKVNYLIDLLKIDKIFYDSTRGELESFVEQGLMSKNMFYPTPFKTTTKSSMASNFERVVINKKIELINDSRMINQILNVTNSLEAVETPEGHGDSFWSIAMAIQGETDKFFVIPYEEAKEVFG